MLRSLDFLIENKGVLEPRLAGSLLSLFDSPLDLVFYDLTSCYFEIERADKATFQEVIGDVKARFPVQRCVVVGGRGLLSKDNLAALSEAELDYIVATEYVRGRLARLKNQETGRRQPGKTLTHEDTLIHLNDYLKKGTWPAITTSGSTPTAGWSVTRMRPTAAMNCSSTVNSSF